MQKNQKSQTIFYFNTEIRIHCNKSGSGSEPHNTILDPEQIPYNECCESGKFIPDPDIFSSRIPDPNKQTTIKRMGKKRFEFENKGTVAEELPEGTEGGECRRP
jgi:hypothetical protein